MKPRILVWDLESTDLEADFGTILCAGYKWHGEKGTHVISLLDFPDAFMDNQTDDSQLVKAFYPILASAHVWVTWYGRRFDVPLFNSKLIEHRLPPLPRVQHVDGWRIAKYQMKLSSNRLKTVCAFLDLPEKTPVLGKIWRRARTGHGPSIEYVIRHCHQDVKILDMAYARLRPWCLDHPHLGLVAGVMDACPTCGKRTLTKQGVRYSRTRKYQQFVCTAKGCRAWCRARLSDSENKVEAV